MKALLIDNIVSYRDRRNNRILCPPDLKASNCSVTFRGRDNLLIIDSSAKTIASVKVDFSADRGVCVLGATPNRSQLSGFFRVGFESILVVGSGATSTKPVQMFCCEKTALLVGDDVMFATNNIIRTDDAHAIYDVVSGKRINVSRNVIIGAHTWISHSARVYSGSQIGDGSVVGAGALVRGAFPNNVTIAGIPARVVRTNIAWERPNISTTVPRLRPDASCIERTSQWWNATAPAGGSPVMGNGFHDALEQLRLHQPDSYWLRQIPAVVGSPR